MITLFAFFSLYFSTQVGAAEGGAEQSLKIYLASLPKTSEPGSIMDIGSGLVLGQIYQKLYGFDSDNHLQPVLVKTQRWSDGFKRLSITIDSAATFSDGERLSSDVVVSSLRRSVKFMGPASRWAFGKVVGFDDFVSGKSKTLAGIESVPPSSIVFTFASPSPNFISTLASSYFAITKLKKGSDHDLIGSGKYVVARSGPLLWELKAVSPRERGDRHPKTLIFRSDAGSDFDVLFTPQPVGGAKSTLISQNYDYLQTIILIFNTKKPQLSKNTIRCAIARKLSSAFGASDYAWQPITIGLPFSWSLDKSNEVDPPELKSMDLTLNYANSAAVFNDELNQKIQDKLDLHIKMVKIPIGKLVDKMKRADYQIALIGFVPDFPNPDALLIPLISSGEQFNFSHYSNKNLDSLLMQASLSSDKTAQIGLYKKAFDTINSECPVTFLGTERGRLFIKPNIHLPKFSSLGYHYLDLSRAEIN